ncbi:MAG: aminotransferase class I/II-fold pyridoxal phosphate-dependent enzyme [Gemmatimonadales bacterium]|jgi:LL-diaminopimelate aminotransferase|nr:aminotransferase class I/II-fold pyridoxal phosphate-dependent enzyme [Gemmatimonadales bacterium]MBT3498850.1 aminotransferase class I/II-fold pyridoxal phosphate-dependent enzyme [Gemmatimonadales bacterium]MBT3775517.1 aminotransferase class I/II-fold pyridoxal phosphate-dependent enzyme [Gemmatimonadales bacterium]MBT3957368.1 aminotransferase class I/II-fold pyridoxal phosphate-dependent enzyme [Gemmatimonadales bacterium]MBT4188482.1 aminotransferase class I/II-fold pyridoxal phosphate
MTRASSRMGDLPPYPLLAMKETRRRLVAEGVDVIDLGAGDADLDPPPAVTERLREVAGEKKYGRYGFQSGLPEFRESVAAWMATRFGVEVDPWAEILPLIGSKDGIAHLPFGYLDPGDVAVIPDPGYQAYAGGIALSGGEAHRVALRPENDFLIPLEDIPSDVRDRTRMLYLNYPNNPTTAVAPDAYLEESVDFCRQQDAILLQDNAYSEIAFNGYRPRSILEFDGAKDVSVEFHSFSKTYNMTGWRLGWAVGNAEAIGVLSRVKSFMDTGQFMGIQAAGVAALESWAEWVPGNVAAFEGRRDAVVKALNDAGYSVVSPQATMYVWVPVPKGEASEQFATRALEQEGVIVLPGSSLGAGGEGFFRIALTVSAERLVEAAKRLGRVI